mmetsp:Transcript_11754/g.18054  ORF Transcript_11754/g.18054 Transcript_11754/m.18054 type:complete len:273 (+) Transcript_11754:470-1288(+)
MAVVALGRFHGPLLVALLVGVDVRGQVHVVQAADGELPADVEFRVGQVAVGNIAVTMITPLFTPAVAHDEDAPLVVVPHRHHRVQPVSGALGVAGVRGLLEAGGPRAEEGLGELQPEDEGVARGEHAPHLVPVHRHLNRIADLEIQGIIEALLWWAFIDLGEIKGPLRLDAGALCHERAQGSGYAHPGVLDLRDKFLMPVPLPHVVLPPHVIDEQPGDVPRGVTRHCAVFPVEVLEKARHGVSTAGIRPRLVLDRGAERAQVNLRRDIALGA